MSEVVLDASAILALIFEEPGAGVVETKLPGAAVSSVNIAEVATKLLDYGMPTSMAKIVIDGLHLDVYPMDEDQAFAIAGLRPLTRHAGLSLGDRACLSLAKRLQLSAMTADRVWKDIEADAGIPIHLIR